MKNLRGGYWFTPEVNRANKQYFQVTVPDHYLNLYMPLASTEGEG